MSIICLALVILLLSSCNSTDRIERDSQLVGTWHVSDSFYAAGVGWVIVDVFQTFNSDGTGRLSYVYWEQEQWSSEFTWSTSNGIVVSIYRHDEQIAVTSGAYEVNDDFLIIDNGHDEIQILQRVNN